MRVVIIGALILLHIYAFVDAASTPRTENPGQLPRVIWMLLTLVPLLGPVVWLVFAWITRTERRYGTRPPSRKSAAPRNPASNSNWVEILLRKSGSIRQQSPDDDQEFLARLDAQARRRRRAAQKRAAKEAKAKDGSPAAPVEHSPEPPAPTSPNPAISTDQDGPLYPRSTPFPAEFGADRQETFPQNDGSFFTGDKRDDSEQDDDDFPPTTDPSGEAD